jgi:hypothetical protein
MMFASAGGTKLAVPVDSTFDPTRIRECSAHFRVSDERMLIAHRK